MPTYNYRCEKCGIIKLVLKMSESEVNKCPECGCEEINIVFTQPPGIQFKGNGFYVNS